MMAESIPSGKSGNQEMHRLLDAHLKRIEEGNDTCRVILHYKKGEFMKTEMAVPKVFGKAEAQAV